MNNDVNETTKILVVTFSNNIFPKSKKGNGFWTF